MKILLTKSIDEKMKKNDNFKAFVFDSLNRHLSGDWGTVSEEDSIANTKEPLFSLSAYTFKDVIIWIKQDVDIITILYPSEY